MGAIHCKEARPCALHIELNPNPKRLNPAPPRPEPYPQSYESLHAQYKGGHYKDPRFFVCGSDLGVSEKWETLL